MRLAYFDVNGTRVTGYAERGKFTLTSSGRDTLEKVLPLARIQDYKIVNEQVIIPSRVMFQKYVYNVTITGG